MFCTRTSNNNKLRQYHIYQSIDSPSCRMCGKTSKTICHIVIECLKIGQREYKIRHYNVSRMVHWKLCEKLSLGKSEKWCLDNPQTVTENAKHKLI